MLPGVVRLASSPETFWAKAMAVQLHTAPDGFLMGGTAGRIRRLREMPLRRIYATGAVAGPARSCHRGSVGMGRRGSRTTTSRWSTGSVSSARSRCCSASPIGWNQFRFESAAEDAWHLGLVTPQSADEYLSKVRRSGRHGVAVMDKWLRKTGTRQRPIASSFEVKVLGAVREAGLPEPSLQHELTLQSGELIHVDLAWPERDVRRRAGRVVVARRRPQAEQGPVTLEGGQRHWLGVDVLRRACDSRISTTSVGRS